MPVLLKARADVNSVKNDDSTSLIVASYLGKAECVQLLLDAKASLEPRDDGGTALDNAIKQKHDVVVRLLRAAASLRAREDGLRFERVSKCMVTMR